MSVTIILQLQPVATRELCLQGNGVLKRKWQPAQDVTIVFLHLGEQVVLDRDVFFYWSFPLFI
jgi:hypothetical protein